MIVITTLNVIATTEGSSYGLITRVLARERSLSAEQAGNL